MPPWCSITRRARGFGMLRRFSRGHSIGPVVAADADGARAVIAHLAALNAGRFTRIDIDVASDLGGWLESLGLAQVDAPTEMVRGAQPAAAADSAAMRSPLRRWVERPWRPDLHARPSYYKADPERGRQWAEIFARRAPETQFRLWPDVGDPAAVRFLAAGSRPRTWPIAFRILSCCSRPAPALTSST